MSAVLLALFFAQRSFLFPVPTIARTAPQAAGFPEAEEHVLTTADGEKVIVWHVPARPGRPVILYFHGNGDFLAGFFGRFRDMIADGTGVVALSYRGYAGSSGQPSERGIAAGCRCGLCLHDGAIQRGQDRRLGIFARHRRCGCAGGGTADRQADPGSALYVDCGCRRIGVLVHAGAAGDAGSVPFRRAHRAGQGSAVDHAWRATIPRFPIVFGERLFALANEPKQFVRFPGAATTIWTISARSKPRGNSSTPQKAERRCLLHSPRNRLEDLIA